MSKYSNLQHFINLAEAYNELSCQDKSVLDCICDAGFPAIANLERRDNLIAFLENLDLMIAVPVVDAKNLLRPLLESSLEK